MTGWFDGILEFIGAGGLSVGGAWLAKELWSGYTKEKFLRKQASIEHDYFRKRLLYETKNDIYKKVYFNLKLVQGTFYTFESKNFDYNFKGYQQKALDNYKQYSTSSKVKIEENILDYTKNDIHRFKINYDLSMQSIIDALRDYNNYLSEIEYMLDKKELKILMTFKNYSNNLKEEVQESQKHFEIKDKYKSYNSLKCEFQEEYEKKCSKLDEIIEEFNEIIKRNLFL